MQSVLLDSLSRQKAWGWGWQLLPQAVLAHRVGCISC